MSLLGNPEIGGSKGPRKAPSVHPPHRTAQSGSGGIPTVRNVSTKSHFLPVLTTDQVTGHAHRFTSRVMPICCRRNRCLRTFSTIARMWFGQMTMCSWRRQIYARPNESRHFDEDSGGFMSPASLASKTLCSSGGFHALAACRAPGITKRRASDLFENFKLL